MSERTRCGGCLRFTTHSIFGLGMNNRPSRRARNSHAPKAVKPIHFRDGH